jgi:hypothetical protein
MGPKGEPIPRRTGRLTVGSTINSTQLKEGSTVACKSTNTVINKKNMAQFIGSCCLFSFVCCYFIKRIFKSKLLLDIQATEQRTFPDTR